MTTTTGFHGQRTAAPTRWAWTGHAAFVVALLFASVSAYSAAGGTVGLDTLGGQIEEPARTREPWFLVWGLLLGAAIWAAVRPTRRPHSA